MKFWSHAATCLLFCFVVVSCDPLDFSADRKKIIEIHFEKATKLYEQRDYKGAIAVYEDLLRKLPDEYEAHFKIAQIYFGNLNDYLNAAYHYQKYVNSPDSASGQIELAKSLLENAKLQFAASVPNSGIQNSTEIVKLRTENIALLKQVEDLKDELLTIRSKPPQPPTQNPPPLIPSPVQNQSPPSTVVKVSPPPAAAAPQPAVTIEPDTRIDPPHPASTAISSATIKTDPASSTRPRTYIVKKGEGVQAIAEKFYGDRSKWRKIVSANPSIKDPDQLKPGQVLKLP